MASAHYRRLLILSITALGLLVAVALAVLFRVHRTLTDAQRSVAAGHHIPFTFGPLPQPVNPGFEPIAAPAAFVSGATLDGAIFLAGPAALNVYTNGNTLERSFRVGLELPAAPLGKMIVARMRGKAEPQLLIATAGAGVLLYDPTARNFQQLLPHDAALADVTALATSDSGELLIGTRRNGVLLYDGKTLEAFRPEYQNAAITSLLAQGGDVWAGTQDHGLLHTRAGVTERIENDLPDPHIEALAGDGTRLYAATPLGIAAFVNGRLERTLAPESFAHALFATSETLTLSTLTDGVQSVRLMGNRPAASAPVDNEPQLVEEFLTLPGSSDLYAVRHDGLFRKTGAHWTSALEPTKAVLTDNNIAAIHFAPDGRLWVGSFDHGLDVLDTTSNTAEHLEDDHLFCINRIALDPQRHTMAVATANGLVLFDAAGKPRQVLTRKQGLISDHVTDVLYTTTPSGEERMTVATPAGLTFIDSTGVRSLYAFQGLVNNHVYALAASASGKELLAGTLGGLSLLRDDAVPRNLTIKNSGLRHNWITAALPTPEGSYMVGTYGAGVMLLDAQGRISPMDRVTRDMVINPNAMLSTSTHIFAGSLNQGLWSYSLASRQWTQITGGLPSLNVTALAARDGQLYVGTQNGLVRIAESRLPA